MTRLTPGRCGGFIGYIPIGVPSLPSYNYSEGSFFVKNVGKRQATVAFYRTSSRRLDVRWFTPANGLAKKEPAGGCPGNFCLTGPALSLAPGGLGRVRFDRSVFGDTWLVWTYDGRIWERLTPADFAKIPNNQKRKITGLTFNTINIA